MKKSLFMMGAALLALASCTNEETVNIPDNRAIGFGDAFIGNVTKATTEMDGTQLQTTGFVVWGGREGLTDLFDATPVSYSNGAWSYSPLRYWEANETYKFAAFAPGIANATPSFDYTNGHVNLTGYTADINTPVDLVYAKANEVTSTNETYNTAVDLSFKHVLSWVKINFKNGFADGTKLTVTDVDVEGVLSTADFTDGAFGTPTTDADLTPVPLKETAENGNIQTVDFTAIPQIVSSLKITFKVTVETEDGNVLATEEAKEATLTNQTWAANNIYSYTATIDGSTIGLSAITFNPSVESWGTTADVDVTDEIQ